MTPTQFKNIADGKWDGAVITPGLRETAKMALK